MKVRPYQELYIDRVLGKAFLPLNFVLLCMSDMQCNTNNFKANHSNCLLFNHDSHDWKVGSYCGLPWNYSFNPLSPHDALKHHFTSLKTDLINLQLRVLEGKFPWNCFTNTWHFPFNFSPTSSHLHPLQVENCDSNSRLVVDEDDNGKLRLERVNSILVTMVTRNDITSKGILANEHKGKRVMTHDTGTPWYEPSGQAGRDDIVINLMRLH